MRTQRDASAGDVAALFDNTVTPRSVQRDIKVLADANLITVTGSGRGRGVRYRIREDAI